MANVMPKEVEKTKKVGKKIAQISLNYAVYSNNSNFPGISHKSDKFCSLSDKNFAEIFQQDGAKCQPTHFHKVNEK